MEDETLGDTVRLSYRARYRDANNQLIDASPVTKTLKVGRPAVEQNNGANNQRKHDIRKLKVRVVVFEKFTGSGPAEPVNHVQDDIQLLRERMAQSTIQVELLELDAGPNDQGVPLPGSLTDGDFVQSALTNNQHTMFSTDELALIAAKDADPNSIDIFYVDSITPAVGTPPKAYSYTATGTAPANQAQSVAGSNWIVMSTDTRPFTLAHEVMHILLNSGHRNLEAATSLFDHPTSPTNSVDATKRIGPNADTAAASVGDGDTAIIRAVAESLP